MSLKKISKAGAVTIPAALRREYGIEGKEKVDVNVNRDGEIIIKRVEGQCIFCKRTDDLEKFEGKYICKDCLTKIKRGA